MRLVIQRVNKALVRVDKKIVGQIDKGLFVLVGVAHGDSEKNAEVLAEKLSKLRVMSDENDPPSPKATGGRGKMNLSIRDLPAGRQGVNASILAVSQFTLFADTSKGNRPSFIKAAEPKLAEKIYGHFVTKLKELGIQVETGEFGAYMKIDVELDGPVTIGLSSE